MKRLRYSYRLISILLVWGGLQCPAAAQKIPEVRGTTFSGASVSLPEGLHGKTGVLVVGFSQGSREQVTAWGKRLAIDYFDSPTVLYYETPMLASVPKMLRGFVLGRIRSSVSDRGKVHFLPLEEKEAEWKALCHYEGADDAYLLVIDEKGFVRWQTHGKQTDTGYATMKQQVDSLRAQTAYPPSR